MLVHRSTILLVTLSVSLLFVSFVSSMSMPSVRPAPSERKFRSAAVDSLIANFTSRMLDHDLATMFENCYPNTLDTTVYSYTPASSTRPPSSFIITGDIPAQWFRDSTNQVLPYVHLAPMDTHLSDLICGLIHRHASDVTHDPFANAFNFNASGAGHQDDTRFPPMTPEVFEGKYELDSLAAVMKLANRYYNVTQDSSCFLEDTNWTNAIKIILQTITDMQAATGSPSSAPYRFQRVSNIPTETCMLDGMGRPSPYTGMSRSAFRPSDDATTFPFLIPAEAMTVVELRNLANMLEMFVEKRKENGSELDQQQQEHILNLMQLQQTASALADEIDTGIQNYGLVKGANGPQYAYEVDGFGSVHMMDDANIPSLLSLPYLGYVELNDSTYQRTRQFVWSQQQGYFWSGSAGAGIGGPHAGVYQIWPMSIVMFGLTSSSDSEIRSALELLKSSTAGTGFLHESFNKDDVYTFTRPWFSWINGLFGEFIIKIAEERPYILFGTQNEDQTPMYDDKQRLVEDEDDATQI